MADTTISLGLDMSDVAKMLAKLPQMTSEEAEKAVRELTRTFEKARVETERLRKATAAAGTAGTASLKSMGQAAGDAESSLRAVSGAVGMISPEAERALNTVAELGGAFEGVTRGTGLLSGMALPALAGAVAAVTVAASAGYAGWVLYTGAARQAEEEARALATTLAGLAPAAARVRDAQTDAALATGALASEQAAYERAVSAAADARDRDVEALIAQSGFTRDQIENTRRLMTSTGEYGAALAATDQGLILAATGVNALSTAYDQQVDAYETVRDAAVKAREERERETAAAEASAAAAKADAAAKARAAEEARVLAEALREEEAALRAEQAALAESEALLARRAALDRRSASVLDGYVQDRLSGYDLIDQREQAALDELSSVYRQRFALAEEQGWSLVALEEELEAARTSVRAEAQTQRAELAVMEAEALAQAQAAALDTVIAGARDVVSAFESVIGDSREAAMAAFAIDKALRISQIGISTIRAAFAAFEPPPVGLGPVAGGALAGVIAATGAASAAAVAMEQPKFHVGGIYARAPDEVTITRSELGGVLSGQGIASMGGPQAVHAANRGEAPSQEVTVLQVYGHRVLDRYVYDSARRAGSPMHDLARVSRGRKPGRR